MTVKCSGAKIGAELVGFPVLMSDGRCVVESAATGVSCPLSVTTAVVGCGACRCPRGKQKPCGCTKGLYRRLGVCPWLHDSLGSHCHHRSHCHAPPPTTTTGMVTTTTITMATVQLKVPFRFDDEYGDAS